MKAVRVQKAVMASELPKARREEGRFAPDRAEGPELAATASLEAVMDIISRRGAQRGLTEERLAEILDER
jgi:hypothetical protein